MWCIGCHLGVVFKDSESNFAVVQPVLHLHLLVSRLTRSWMALTFSTLSQPMVRWWPSVSYSPPITVEGLSRTMLFLSACLHILMIQHDLFQWRHKASVDGIIWFSKVILPLMFWWISVTKHCVGAVGHGKTPENLLKCEAGELVSNPEACFL